MRQQYLEKMLEAFVNTPSGDWQRIAQLKAKTHILLKKDDIRCASVMKELDNNKL